MSVNNDLYAQLQALANSLPDPILVIDYNGQYVAVLGGTDRTFYDSAHPLVGCYMQDVLPEDKQSFFLQIVRKAIDTGGLQICEYQLSSDQVEATQNNGPEGMQWFQGRVYPVQTFPGMTPSAVWLVINITEQKRLEERLKRLSQIDDLTGTFNRRYFMEVLQKEFQLAKRHHRSLSLLSIDIDHFKDINDRYGHSQGDQALQHLIKTVRCHLRAEDVLARVGGEEFAILCPMTDRQQAGDLAERIRQIVADTRLDTSCGPIRLTISLGVATLGEDECNADSLLLRVDKALYRAKHDGRNQVYRAWDLPALSASMTTAGS
jgi:diguanylate cyclase (GGDEF)-like protein/PAS domain S-box-containing protein